MNWCQARGYCQWAGKDLCGALDGGMLANTGTAVLDTARAAWMRACTGGGSVAFGYANTYAAGVCNSYSRDAGGKLEDVQNRPGCVGGLPGLYDMLGNVREWILACDITDAAADVRQCAYAGQSFVSDIAERPCTTAWSSARMVEDFTDTGFRCCAP